MANDRSQMISVRFDFTKKQGAYNATLPKPGEARRRPYKEGVCNTPPRELRDAWRRRYKERVQRAPTLCYVNLFAFGRNESRGASRLARQFVAVLSPATSA